VRRQLTGGGTVRTFDNAFTERCGPSDPVRWNNRGDSAVLIDDMGMEVDEYTY
jgi:hypothetical protein